MDKSAENTRPEGNSSVASKLLSMMSYDQKVVTADIDNCRFDGEEMSLSDKDRASFVAQSGEFQTWLLRTDTSSALLVLANIEQSTVLFSPLSFLAAELAHMYADTDTTAAISFF